MINCEICSKGIDNYFGCLVDFYPDKFPLRDTSVDQTLYGVQVGKDEFHFYCSEEHQILGKKELDEQN